MNARKRKPPVFTIAGIGQAFELVSYWFGEKWCPAVRRTETGFQVRVLKSLTIVGNDQRFIFDYFVLDPDGTITTAPRGYAKDYKPGLVADIEAVAAQYEAPQADARRIA